jgi:hypothetical protein
MKKEHKLKSWPESFNAIRSGAKAHELRRNDRGFQVGDALILREYDPKTRTYSGREIVAEVTYVTSRANSKPLCSI